jgi:hypothetical protein
MVFSSPCRLNTAMAVDNAARWCKQCAGYADRRLNASRGCRSSQSVTCSLRFRLQQQCRQLRRRGCDDRFDPFGAAMLGTVSVSPGDEARFRLPVGW